MRTVREYFARKEREIALLDRCLYTPLEPSLRKSVSEAIELKFQLAALLKAEQNIRRWSITETARPPARWQKAGPSALNSQRSSR